MSRPRVRKHRKASARPSRAGAVGLLVLAVAVGACGSGSSESGDESGESTDLSIPAHHDVVISSCAPSDDQTEGYLAKLTVTNRATVANDYVVVVSFVGPDGAERLDTVALSVPRVEPGQTVEDEIASTSAELRSTPGVTCTVDSATRSDADRI